MSCTYQGTIFDKRGCYVILPASPFWRLDANDNTADVDEEVEVLEGPEVEIRDSCDGDEGADMGEADVLTVVAKCDDESRDSDNKHGKSISFPKKKAPTEPDNKYYEVEAILDGPKKRREHLFKVCYKVRWKGYGPESDTWQPIADLVNVQDMIEDYRKEKDLQKHDKFKKKSVTSSLQTGTDCEVKNRSVSSPSPEEKNTDRKQYDPVYGTVKDKFWKDLELGRHQNHSYQFHGDMYSKVKGSRRAAHTEALASIHRQRRREGKSLHTSRSSSRVLRGDYLYKSRSSSPVSSKHRISRRSESPQLSPVGRQRKRSTDPFSTAEYTSAKRCRRSRDAKNGNIPFEDKQPSIISSVTSETVAIVTTSSLLTPPVVSNSNALSFHLAVSTVNSDVLMSSPGITACSRSSSPVGETEESSESDDSADEGFSDGNQTGVMIVSSETMLTVTTETTRLDDSRFFYEDVRSRKSRTKTCRHSDVSMRATDGASSTCSPMVSVGASGCDLLAGASFDTCGGTSGGSPPDGSQIHKVLSHMRSALDTQSEASGAVERSHDAECLWNGACNRSDCKSNRRRNMKNGQRKFGGVIPAAGDDGGSDVEIENTAAEDENNGDGSDRVHVGNENLDTAEGDSMMCSSEGEEMEGACVATEHRDQNTSGAPSASETKSTSTSSKTSTAGNKPSGSLMGASFQSSSSSRRGDSSSPSTASSSSRKDHKSVGRLSSEHKYRNKSGSQSHSSARDRRLLYSSSHTDSSDSSFDDTTFGGPSLSREAVSDSFFRIAKQADIDTSTVASTSGTGAPGSLIPQKSLEGYSTQGRKSYMEAERPGLFSENNGAFMFLEQDSGDIHSTTTREGYEEGSFSQASNSPSGKENFGNSSMKTGGLATQLKVTNDMDVPTTHSGGLASSHVRSHPRQTRTLMEDLEGSAVRKRSSDVSQPLEKLPSPNSRDCELNERIVTLTCDELEDFVEQGEEHYSRKDTCFISNADLLQAVNLSKAEVVKRAIKQVRSNEHKLDLEQADSSGLTLLMRAVHRGALAIVEMLLEHGVNVNAQQTNGTTALMIAAEQNGTCLVALLLKYGANSSLYTINSDQAETALMKAIKKQNRDVVNLMLRVGVNIAPPTCASFSALELAIERRNPHIEGLVRFHCQRLEQAFRSRILATLDGTANLMEPLFGMQCFPLRESIQFVVKFNSNIHPVAPGEGFLLFIAHTKITEKGVKCRFHGVCPISSVTLNGIVQSPLTKDVHFVTSCHPIIQGCNTLVINKLPDYTSKAKLVAQAFRAKLLPG